MPDPERRTIVAPDGTRYYVVEQTLWPECQPIFNERGQCVGWANWMTMRSRLEPVAEYL